MDTTKRDASESPDEQQRKKAKTGESDSETDNSEETGGQSLESTSGEGLPSDSDESNSDSMGSSSSGSSQQILFELLTDEDYYKAVSELGSGSFGTVYKGIRRSDEEEVAIKLLSKNLVDADNIEHEVSLALLLMEDIHPNIMNFYETHDTPASTFLISEFSPFGDLFKAMQIENDLGNEIWVQLDENTSRHLTIGIAKGLQHLHGIRVAHGDLKLHNVLLFPNLDIGDEPGNQHITRFDSWTPKLCDFSNSQIGDIDNPTEPIMYDQECCAVAFAAPESYEGIQYDCIIADIFSLGCCLLSMLIGAYPFTPPLDPLDLTNATEEQVEAFRETTNQLTNKFKYDTGFKKRQYKMFSHSLRNLLDGLLEANPQNRFTLDQFFAREWITRPQSREFEDVSGNVSHLLTHPFLAGIQYLTYAADY